MCCAAQPQAPISQMEAISGRKESITGGNQGMPAQAGQGIPPGDLRVQSAMPPLGGAQMARAQAQYAQSMLEGASSGQPMQLGPFGQTTQMQQMQMQQAAAQAQMHPLGVMQAMGAAQGGQALARATFVSDERASPPLPPPPPPEMTASYDDMNGMPQTPSSAGLPPPPPPDFGMAMNASVGGLVQPGGVPLGMNPAGLRQSNPSGFRQSWGQNQQQTMDLLGGSVGAGPGAAGTPEWRVKSPQEPEWAPTQYLEKAFAIYDYTAAQVDELTIVEGQPLYILKKNDDDWWEAITCRPGASDAPGNAIRGLVPSNYLESTRD